MRELSINEIQIISGGKNYPELWFVGTTFGLMVGFMGVLFCSTFGMPFPTKGQLQWVALATGMGVLFGGYMNLEANARGL